MEKVSVREGRASDSYFEDYGVLQHYKHHLLGSYLGAWYPKLANSHSRAVQYIETHSGRGRHKTGQAGSPIVALNTLLQHSQRDRILSRTTINYYLLELNPEYADALRAEIAGIVLPDRVKCSVITDDFKRRMTNEFARMDANGGVMVPTLTFVDPFNYDLPKELISRVVRDVGCEVMITFMAQQIARAIRDGTKDELITRVYGSDDWMALRSVENFEELKQQTIREYAKSMNATWCTSLRLRGQSDYAVMHFTNHPAGRREMKRAIWRIDKSGGFQMFRSDNPDQLTLIELEPDLSPLERQLRTAYGNQTVQYGDLVDWLLETDYTETHLHKVMRSGRKHWMISEHKGPIGPSMKSPITILGYEIGIQ